MMSKFPLTAYVVAKLNTRILKGRKSRKWMDESSNRFAYRCLPLVISNQLGWDILCPASFIAKWSGGDRASAVKIKFKHTDSPSISSHFGHGILTFNIDFLFRTPEGHNLIVKGPPNYPKDGIAPLEGVVETDWAPATFTMNWKFTRPRTKVHFAEGEPICRILPYPRNYIEKFHCTTTEISNNKGLYEEYIAWRESRSSFIDNLDNPDSTALQKGWQRDYMLGKTPDGKRNTNHQSKIDLEDF